MFRGWARGWFGGCSVVCVSECDVSLAECAGEGGGSRGTRNSQMCFQSGLRTADKEAPSHTWPPPDTILPWDLVPGFYFIRGQDSCEDTLLYLQFVNILKYLLYWVAFRLVLVESLGMSSISINLNEWTKMNEMRGPRLLIPTLGQ